MNSTPRLGLPFLSAGQAQKEIFVNESLQALDFLVAGCVEEPPRNDPPNAPAVGACYIVDAAPTGAWAGNPFSIAAYSSVGLRLISPEEGMTFIVRSDGTVAVYRAGVWEVGNVRASSLMIGGQQVVGSQADPIASASGGATVDAEARAVLDQILVAMRQHGLIAP
jgi:Protein of unknown function (DUF2793)